ncbi:MAG: HlyD family efflux transporter periplasmic adaptor subunit [Prevotellaceae bacterium]|jgi:multidrug efflux pump subunit AcrA (membrane-fusion protein)|nr:HlyD family efflux transporter periplasmic adaptor subunit [Prevotellaceae bacterium]
MKRNLTFLSIAFFLLSCGNENSMKPQYRDVTELVFASGVLEANNQYNLMAQTDGYIVKIDFNESDIVGEGQVLAVIDNSQNVLNAQSAEELYRIAEQNTKDDSPALKQIEANIVASEAKLRLDSEQAERYKRLYEKNSVSKLEYENARLAAVRSESELNALREQYHTQKRLAQEQEVSQRFLKGINQITESRNNVRAIVGGKIYRKDKHPGDYAGRGDVIAVIGDPDFIYAKLNIDESNMSRIKQGQAVTIRLNTDKSKTYRAEIGEILPSFDLENQSFIVKAWFKDSLDFRIAGTQLEANITVGEKKNVLVIPRNYMDYGNTVTLADKKKVKVETGIVSNEWVEILGGIDEHTEIVLNNQ